VIRIAISVEAFEAIARTMPFGFEVEANDPTTRHVWLKEVWVNRLTAMRGPGESTSDVIVRLAGIEGACAA
jgi:hypothetical protein